MKKNNASFIHNSQNFGCTTYLLMFFYNTTYVFTDRYIKDRVDQKHSVFCQNGSDLQNPNSFEKL